MDMHLHGLPRVVGRGNTELGEEKSKRSERPSAEASSIGRGDPIEAPSKWGERVRPAPRSGPVSFLWDYNLWWDYWSWRRHWRSSGQASDSNQFCHVFGEHGKGVCSGLV